MAGLRPEVRRSRMADITNSVVASTARPQPDVRALDFVAWRKFGRSPLWLEFNSSEWDKAQEVTALLSRTDLEFVLLAVPLAACGGTITDKGYIAATIEASVAEERANVNVPVMLST